MKTIQKNAVTTVAIMAALAILFAIVVPVANPKANVKLASTGYELAEVDSLPEDMVLGWWKFENTKGEEYLYSSPIGFVEGDTLIGRALSANKSEPAKTELAPANMAATVAMYVPGVEGAVSSVIPRETVPVVGNVAMYCGETLPEDAPRVL